MFSRKFLAFIKLADYFYFTIGNTPYNKQQDEEPNNKRFYRTLALNIFFCFNVINMNIWCFGELYNAIASFSSDNLVQATMALSLMCFDMVSNSKMLFVWWKRRQITYFINELHEIFPKSELDELRYNLPPYLKRCTWITTTFAVMYMLLIWTYNTFSFLQYLIYDKWLKLRVIGKELPYVAQIPWDWKDHWSYYVLFASQSWAAYTAAVGQIAIDLLLFAAATQMIMHFDYVSRTIERYRTGDKEDDIKYMGNLVVHHERIYNLTNVMNDIFGVPLFFNLMISTAVICFVGFQMTIGVQTDELLKLFVFFFFTMAQVYVICWYGEELITASEGISLAVFHHDWTSADVCYKKMLVLIAMRAQKPAVLKATFLIVISRRTTTELLQMSYKFFAVIRTRYTG